MTKSELIKKIKSLNLKDKQQIKNIVCDLIGHSKIQNLCWNQYTCGRCGNLMGDNLASFYYGAETAVIIGHNCKQCKENYKKCTWKDKYLVENPFKNQK